VRQVILILGCVLMIVLLLTGCAEKEEIVEEVREAVAKGINETNLTLCPECPVCETCEVCQECEACPQTNCEVSGDLVELELDEITLSTTSTGPTNDIVVAKYTLEQYDKIESGKLSFVAECDQAPGDLEIELWDDTFYAKEPSCFVTEEIAIVPSSLELGRNTFTFTTLGNIDYVIGDIKLVTQYTDGTSDTQELYSVSFTPSEGDKENFETLDDVNLLNYKEFEIELTGSESEEDYTLTFEGDDRDGLLVIQVNNHEVYNGPVERHNELVISNEYLERGENHILFIGR
jgi:hypothetical protein